MLLIDASNVIKGSILANLYKIGVAESPEGLGMIRHVALSSLMNYAKKFAKYGKPIIACDSPNGYWRKDIFPDYKMNRKRQQEESVIDWKFVSAATKVVIAEVKENFPWAVIQVDKAEADDIIGVMSKNQTPTMCVSADNDTLQCSRYNPYYQQYSPIIASQGKDGFITLNQEDVMTDLIEHIIRASDDGIPNVLSESSCFMTGTKQNVTTAAFLSRFLEVPSTSMLEGVLESMLVELKEELDTLKPLQETKPTKGRLEKIEGIYKKLGMYNGAFERIKMNRTLIDFDYIPDHIVKAINDAVVSMEIRGSASKAMNYMMNKNLNMLLDRVNELA